MRAAVIERFGGIESIEIQEVPIPKPLPDEVQIAVVAAGVNPVDWKVSDGLLKNRMPHEFPITLGWDVAGVISEVGSKTTHLKVGDEVFAYARKEVIRDGSFAEFLCLKEEHVILKPKTLSFVEAACVPLSALTAWQALIDAASLKKGEHVLIHAGAGGVGTFAIQIAKIHGAHVLTTASVPHHDYVQELGADVVIDYTQENFVEVVHSRCDGGADVVFDTVGGNALKASYEAVREGGRLVTIAGVLDQALSSERGLTAEFVFVAPNQKELKHISRLIDEGKMRLPRLQELPLEEVKLALRKIREGHTEGKIALTVRSIQEKNFSLP